MRAGQEYKHVVGGTVWQILHSDMNNFPYCLARVPKKIKEF
jgi:hypothetical protein